MRRRRRSRESALRRREGCTGSDKRRRSAGRGKRPRLRGRGLRSRSNMKMKLGLSGNKNSSLFRLFKLSVALSHKVREDSRELTPKTLALLKTTAVFQAIKRMKK